jgi:PAS domain S-box-containing protein
MRRQRPRLSLSRAAALPANRTAVSAFSTRETALQDSGHTTSPPIAKGVRRQGSALLTLGALLTVVVAALDAVFPLGTGIGPLYALPLLILSSAGTPRFAMYAAWMATLLIVIRVLVVPLERVAVTTLSIRTVAIIVVWATAWIVARQRRTTTELELSARDLADVKYAIDHSAIVATTNTRGTITYVNDKFCEISKYDREELLGQDHRILNSGYHPKEFMRDLWRTIANGRIWRGEIRNRAKDGSIYWVHTTIVPFLDDHGKPYQYMAIRYEITDRKRSEDKLREQAALTRLGEMAAVVAHEVKNPIAGIRGALQVIASRMPAETRDRDVIRDIIARLDALNGIVQDLLLYARPRQPKREAVDVARLIGSIVDLLHRDPALAGTSVRVTGELPPIAADPEQLRIVFQNLIMNAAQAMAGHGAIDITLASNGDGCQISVRDHGPGMPPDVREKAFDAFFTTKHRGTGLGLPIARRMVEAHGGQIDIADADGGGSVITVRLPLVRS